ncbi:MAG: DNA mismatch repair protein [Prevotella sp.]|jgi:DNA mismatch repair ATPase MutS|nr:DNA mismatch repair protein [Prevotella sp.]
MSFIIDKQTQEDLNLLGKFKKNSIINLFNQTHTRRGELLLERMFMTPLQDTEQINQRSSIIKYFEDIDIEFPVPNSLYSDVISYIESSSGSKLSTVLGTISKKINFFIVGDNSFEIIQKGIVSMAKMLNIVKEFIDKINLSDNPYQAQSDEIKSIFDNKLSAIIANQNFEHLSFIQTLRYDKLFRYSYRYQLGRLIEILSEIDVFIAVSKTARVKKMSYARAIPKEEHSTQIKDLFHPSLKTPVSNSVSINRNKNIIFLTGANMAGKSTFMKSYGIATYLAHMGFPVPAKDMTFSVLDGMYTSINVPDNIALGYSHFYAEVLRVKHVAEEVSKSKNMLIIFDELFKGTNVKDAFDATVSVTKAFGKWDNCAYIISTHIVEASEVLLNNNNIQFLYLPTKLDNNRPLYTYKLEQGISSDRHGMMIINNERIVEIIKDKSETIKFDK